MTFAGSRHMHSRGEGKSAVEPPADLVCAGRWIRRAAEDYDQTLSCRSIFMDVYDRPCMCQSSHVRQK